MLLEGEERLQALAFEGVLGDGGLLEAHDVDLVMEVEVSLAGAAEVEVVAPGGADEGAGGVNGALGGREDGDQPGAGDGDVGVVRHGEAGGGGRAGGDGRGSRVTHLDGQANRLEDQEGHQDKRVLEAGEEGVHAGL